MQIVSVPRHHLDICVTFGFDRELYSLVALMKLA